MRTSACMKRFGTWMNCGRSYGIWSKIGITGIQPLTREWKNTDARNATLFSRHMTLGLCICHRGIRIRSLRGAPIAIISKPFPLTKRTLKSTNHYGRCWSWPSKRKKQGSWKNYWNVFQRFFDFEIHKYIPETLNQLIEWISIANRWELGGININRCKKGSLEDYIRNEAYKLCSDEEIKQITNAFRKNSLTQTPRSYQG